MEGVLRALEDADAVGEAVAACATRADAVLCLTSSPWRMSETQANHVLDLQIAMRTRGAIRDLEEEVAAVMRMIEELEQPH